MSLSMAVRLPFVVSLALALGTATAAAQAADNHRYQMQEVEGGVVRLDTVTGGMTLCLTKQDRLVCDPAENRMKALTTRIDELEKRLARLEAEEPQAGAGEPSEPTDRQLDEAMDTMKRVMQHFFGMVRDFEKELRKPSGRDEDPSPGTHRT